MTDADKLFARGCYIIILCLSVMWDSTLCQCCVHDFSKLEKCCSLRSMDLTIVCFADMALVYQKQCQV